MRILLVRHGRTSHNVNHLAQGHLDTDLDETGRLQAEKIGTGLRNSGVSRIYSSDLRRAFDTAIPLASALDIKIEATPILRERFLGELEGAPLTRLRKAFDAEVEATGVSRYKVRPLGAESAYDVMERAQNFIAGLPIVNESVAVFTHGMMKEVLLCALIKAPVECSRSFRFDNGSITELRFAHGVWVLERFNCTDHL